jgi:hypothetical protein
VKQSTTTCKCSRCQTIPGCSKYDTTTCKCTRASPAAYVVLPSGVTGGARSASLTNQRDRRTAQTFYAPTTYTTQPGPEHTRPHPPL